MKINIFEKLLHHEILIHLYFFIYYLYFYIFIYIFRIYFYYLSSKVIIIQFGR